MPERYRVKYTERSAADLTEIFEYIQKDSPPSAARVIERLIKAIESLDFMPLRNRVVTNSDEVGIEIRSMVVRPYLIRYHVDERLRLVTILSVRHGARE